MMLFWCFVLSSIFYAFSADPVCCLDYLTPESLASLPCNLSCSLEHENADFKCDSCLTRILNSQNYSNGLTEYTTAKPTIICQALTRKQNKILGKVVLTWSSENITSSVFFIEARNSTSLKWRFVGMTDQTFAVITDLDSELDYQFRIIPFLVPNSILPTLVSDWTFILGTERPISAPMNISVNNFRLENGTISASVQWNASRENPCSYILNWFPLFGDDSYGQKLIELPQDNLSTVLTGLSSHAKYDLKIAAFDLFLVRQIHVAELSFITPSCLFLTNGNFSLCAPGPPLNLVVSASSESVVQLSWTEPKYSALDNQVSGYQIFVIEASQKHYILLRPEDTFFVKGDILNASISNLRPNIVYVFQVRAFSIAGVGKPAEAQFETKAPSLTYQPLDYVPWHYIVPSAMFALIVMIAALVCKCLKSKKKPRRQRGYFSGSADVPDRIRPCLLQSNAIELQEEVGYGEFAVVHKAVYARKKEKEIVAVKVYPAETVSRSRLLQEVDVLLTVGRHRNIVSLIGFTLDINKMYLVLEYCALGNLHSKLRGLKKELSFIKRQLSDPKEPLMKKVKDEAYGVRLCSYIHQIALGMAHISSLRLVHRDLAARNILLCSERHVKIADFGLSRDIYKTQSYTITKQKKLPLKWMAPESIEQHVFTTQTDVWSFGVLVWEIFKFGKIPYAGLYNSALLSFLKSGYRLPKPQATSDEWFDLMLDCWHIDPQKRPNFKELVQKTESILSKHSQYTTIHD